MEKNDERIVAFDGGVCNSCYVKVKNPKFFRNVNNHTSIDFPKTMNDSDIFRAVTMLQS